MSVHSSDNYFLSIGRCGWQRTMWLLVFALAFFPPTATSLSSSEYIAIETQAIPLDSENPDRNTIGALRYRGGFEISSYDTRLGGLSSLAISDDGLSLISLSDKGIKLNARLTYDHNGLLVGLADPTLNTLKNLDGAPLSGKKNSDAESVATDGEGGIFVAFERRHRIWHYAADGSPPKPLPKPPGIEKAPKNKGIEALTRLQDGRLLALTEKLETEYGVVGWLGDARGWSPLQYINKDGWFSPAGAATLPNGDVAVLEKQRNEKLQGYTIRIKRIPIARIKSGAHLEGRILAEFNLSLNTGKFEGIDARLDKQGRTLIYLISDNDFSKDDRTQLMMFELMD